MTVPPLVIASVSDVPENDVIAVTVQDHMLAVYNVDGKIYASDDRCSHGNAQLSDGYVEDGLIECPLHSGTFKICDGSPCDPPAVVPMKVYQVAVQGNDIVLLDPSELYDS